jgi:hypothetical protein
MRGYCEICNNEYANIYQHRQTQRHKDRESLINESRGQEETKNISGIIEPENNTIEQEEETNESQEEQIREPEQRSTIQIIDSNTNKPSKNIIEKALDIAFSEQYAPITVSILNGVAERFNNTHNPEQKAGNIIKTVSGAEILVRNKDF